MSESETIIQAIEDKKDYEKIIETALTQLAEKYHYAAIDVNIEVLRVYNKIGKDTSEFKVKINLII